MRTRPAEAGDFEVVAALLEELGRAPVTDATRDRCRALFLDQLADPAADHAVVEDGGRVVGFCSLHFRDRLNHPTPDAWIPDLIVTAGVRRRGAAQALLQQAEHRARERGCRYLTLESGHQRDDAHRLYLAFGMADTGKQFTKPFG